MKKHIQKVKHHAGSRGGQIFFAAVALAVGYALASRAIDTASWWCYLGTIIALYVAIRFLVRALSK